MVSGIFKSRSVESITVDEWKLLLEDGAFRGRQIDRVSMALAVKTFEDLKYKVIEGKPFISLMDEAGTEFEMDLNKIKKCKPDWSWARFTHWVKSLFCVEDEGFEERIGNLAEGIYQKLHNRDTLSNVPNPYELANSLPPLISQMIHELCEKDLEDYEKPCSFERLGEILNHLEQSNILEAINCTPACNTGLPTWWSSDPWAQNPISHWAVKGNLEGVKLLIQSGAKDRVDGAYGALYFAALGGHTELVGYLLEQPGFSVTIPFYESALRHFIPSFFFGAIHETTRSSQIDCLERILEYISQKDPENLKLQLKIPVGDNCNSLAWISFQEELTGKVMKDPGLRERIVSLLKHYGSTETDVFSWEEILAFSPDEVETLYTPGINK